MNVEDGQLKYQKKADDRRLVEQTENKHQSILDTISVSWGDLWVGGGGPSRRVLRVHTTVDNNPLLSEVRCRQTMSNEKNLYTIILFIRKTVSLSLLKCSFYNNIISDNEVHSSLARDRIDKNYN